VPLLIVDDLGMRKLPQTAAEDLLELVMRRYERASTLLTSNRPVDDWGKLLGDSAAANGRLCAADLGLGGLPPFTGRLESRGGRQSRRRIAWRTSWLGLGSRRARRRARLCQTLQ